MAVKKALPLSVKQMIELDGCVRCEICREECSLYKLMNGNPHPLRFPTSCGGIVRRFRSLVRSEHSLKAKLLGLRSPSNQEIWELADALFLNCSLCGRCEVYCPLGINTHELITSMREYFLERLANFHCAVEFLNNMHKLVSESGNVYGLDNSARMDWSQYTGVNLKVKDSADIVYFVGCVSSYQGRAQDIASAIASILNGLNENWTVLKEEACCGHPLTVSGGINGAKRLIEQNIRQISSVGAKIVVTGCPGCYLALKHEWPRVLGYNPDLKVLHFTELLSHYAKKGKLKLPRLHAKITYHDPCELGRLGGVIEEPRVLIKTLTDSYTEPYGHGIEGICCGSGGMLRATNPSLSEQLALQRLKMLTDTDSEYVLTACPTCVHAFELANKALKKEIKILDLSQLVAQELGLM